MQLNFNQPIRQLINSTAQEYVTSCQLISDNLGTMDLILDINHQVVFASKMLNLQFSIKEEISGKHLSIFIEQIFPANAVNIEELVTTHQQIISENQRRIYLEIHKQDNNTIEAYISYKTPIFDKSNNFLGLHIQYKPFTVARLANLGAKFHKVEGYYPLKRNEFANIELTRVQQQIIYLYVRNYSYTEIADWMNRLGHRISPAAVNK